MSFRDRDDRNYDYGGYNWDDEEHKDIHFYRPDGLNGWNKPFP